MPKRNSILLYYQHLKSSGYHSDRRQRSALLFLLLVKKIFLVLVHQLMRDLIAPCWRRLVRHERKTQTQKGTQHEGFSKEIAVVKHSRDLIYANPRKQLWSRVRLTSRFTFLKSWTLNCDQKKKHPKNLHSKPVMTGKHLEKSVNSDQAVTVHILIICLGQNNHGTKYEIKQEMTNNNLSLIIQEIFLNEVPDDKCSVNVAANE